MNAKLKEYMHIIERYRKIKGVPPLEKGNPVKVLELIDRVSSTGLMFPEEYRDFLIQYDGFDFLGIMIYATETRPSIMPGAEVFGFIETNNAYKYDGSGEEGCTFFGESGMDSFMYDSIQKQFCVVDRTSLDRDESFDTFDDMLLSIFEAEVEDLKELIAGKGATA